MNNEVLIVGAGPSGLAMAISLSNQDIPYKIIDKNEGPGVESRAMSIQARVLEFYSQFGFADKVVEKGIVPDVMNMYKNGKNIAEISVGNIGLNLSPYPYMLNLPQDLHERILVEELEKVGGKIDWNQQLLSFKDEGNNVTTTISTPTGEITQTFSYVCGCDGASSAIRKGLNIDFMGGTYQQTLFVADVENDIELKGASIGFDDNYFCIQMPVKSKKQIRLTGLIPDEYKVNGEAPTEFTPLIPYIENILQLKINKVNWYSSYHSHHRVAEKFRVNRIFICGDAGHIHSPAGGQGMNTGISDAINLAWKMAAVLKGKSSLDLLDTYETERIKFAQKLVDTTDKTFQNMTNSSSIKKTIASFLVPRILKYNTMKKRTFKNISQINISYQNSELSYGKYGKVKGGDRLPWVKNNKIDNFEPLKSYDWQIHVYGQVNQSLKQLSSETGISIYNVSWSKSMSSKGIKENSVFLIRPDSYISVATDIEKLEPIKVMINKFNIGCLN